MFYDPRVQPTETEWGEFVGSQVKAWEGAWDEARKADEMYFQTRDIWSDWKKRNPLDSTRRPPFHSGTFTGRVNQAVAAHLAFEPTFRREPVGEGEEHSAAAGRLEKGLQAIVHDAFQRALNYPTRENGKQLVMYNITRLLVLPDTAGLVRPKRRKGENQQDWEEREWEWMSSGSHWNPIRFVVPTLHEVLMDPLEMNPPIMVWRRKIRANHLDELLINRRERYRRLKGAKVKQFSDAFVGEFDLTDAEEDVDVEEWWTVRWHGMRQKNKGTLFWEPNLFGVQPGLQVWGGSSISPVLEDFDVKWWVQQAMMQSVIDEVIMEAQATAGHHELLQKAAFPPIITPVDAGEIAEALSHGIVQADASEVAWLKAPDLPAQSFQHQQGLLESIERNTFSNVVAGFQKNEAETATGMVILSESAERTFKPAISKMEHLYTSGGSHIQKMVYRMQKEYGDEFGEIGTGKAKLRVKDMGNPPRFHIEARFHQINAVVEMQSRQQDLVLLEKGLISEAYFYAQHGFEDPDGMRIERYADLMRKDPMYVEQGIINAFREARMHQMADRQGALDVSMAQRMMGQGNGGSLNTGENIAVQGAEVQPPPVRPMVGNGRPVRRMP